MLSEVTTISEVLERLAVYGGAGVSPDLLSWLSACGVADAHPAIPAWAVPSLPWLRRILPAGNRQDLLRKTMIRDPRYRLHLDLSLARVIQIIARSERWHRFEDLVFGDLRPLSQRLLALTEWVAESCKKTPCSLTDRDWSDFSRNVLLDVDEHFRAWDRELWGDTRDSADLFPLLEGLYLPIADQPLHFRLSGNEARFMEGLIQAAAADDGVALSDADLAVCEQLRRIGAPVLHRAGSNICWLTLCVELSSDEEHSASVPPMQSAPLGVPALARQSAILSETRGAPWLLKSDDGGWAMGATFLSVVPGSETWPETREQGPPWATLPAGGEFSETSFGSNRAGLEEAVGMIDRHPVYGFLFQLFVTEALDRELGDDTILFAPPLDIAGPEAEWRTSILYRPVQQLGRTAPSENPGYFSLGRIDAVLDHVAKRIGLDLLPLPYSRVGHGLWSWALHLLIELKIVVGQRDRWTLSAALHDRLYTGSLMGRVLRNRRTLRERIRVSLDELWNRARLGSAESRIGTEVVA